MKIIKGYKKPTHGRGKPTVIIFNKDTLKPGETASKVKMRSLPAWDGFATLKTARREERFRV